MSNVELGNRGEDLAASFLERHGYVILDRNYRFERAEVDLVGFEPAADGKGGEVVFVEVKTRRGVAYGRPEAAVTADKQHQIAKAAEAFLYERRLEGAPCRFDVIAILLRGEEPEIEHFRDAFWAG